MSESTEGGVDADEFGRELLNATEGDTVSFSFVLDGVEHSETTTITEHQHRPSSIRPDDAPLPVDITVKNDDGVEYIFVCSIESDGEFIPGFGAPVPFERERPEDETATQLTDAELTAFDVQ